MSVVLIEASGAYLKNFTGEAPDGTIIGVLAEDAAACAELLDFASGAAEPGQGAVEASAPRRALGAGDPFMLAPAGVLALHHTFSRHGALVRARARLGLERLRRSGATILLASNEQDLLRELCDEIWWLDQGALRLKGYPDEVLAAYNTHVSLQLREWAATVKQTLEPAMRRGDGRAQIVAIELLDSSGRPVIVWQSGDRVAVRITVQFAGAVDDPVVGMMIRTRIGFEVFGTNTEIEGVKLGPVAAGETLSVNFGFQCDLCPQEYTLTAASHDPNGVWHDWLEDALAFRVADSRYTAGVAKLRAAVTVERR